MSEKLQVKTELLLWAQERSGISMDDLCEKFPKLPDWLSGEAQPTLKQLESFAKATYAPFGYFFLSEPPEEKLPIPDFRTVNDQGVTRPSPHLLETIYAVQLRQEWMKGFLTDQGEPVLNFIGSRKLDDSPDAVAADMRKVLGLDTKWSRTQKTWEDALRFLIQKIEDIGVLVMVNGVVENNTRRPLNVEEFRGFVISDVRAPVIFINGTDAKAAQMFTVVHELAHLWLGKGGVSDFKELLPSQNAIEIFCNKVAAEFLVPASEMKTAWPEVKGNPQPFEQLARRFKVSPIVTARRLLDLGLISRAQYFAFYNEYAKAAQARKSITKGGGDFYRTVGVRLGKRFPTAVYIAAREGRLPYREAYQLTGLYGASYDRFGKELGVQV